MFVYVDVSFRWTRGVSGTQPMSLVYSFASIIFTHEGLAALDLSRSPQGTQQETYVISVSFEIICQAIHFQQNL